MSRAGGFVALLVGLFSATFAYGGDDPARAASQTSEQERRAALQVFLEAPIDLAEFKRKKGPSNSSGMKPAPCFHRPEAHGFYYWYGLFASPRDVPESQRLGGLLVIVYKSGGQIGDFYDANETLIAIQCRMADPDLGQANLVGSAVDAIRRRFGDPISAEDDLVIYHHEGRAISLHATDGTIDWYKYVRLRGKLDDASQVPEWLLDYCASPDLPTRCPNRAPPPVNSRLQ